MQAEISLLHQTARSFAEAGVKVFPCAQNSKLPACSNGFKDATIDLAQIDAWWNENPNYNIALCPEDAGWCVLDPDGQEGEAALATLEAEHGTLPATYTVRTPRGGRHLYFEGSLPSTVKKLGPKLDTRGVGGYVLAPPSVIDGKTYEVINDAEIMPVPRWIGGRLQSTVQRVAAATSNIDERAAYSRARDLLLGLVHRGDVAVSGSGGNDRTYRLACDLHNLGVTPAVSRALLEEVWNPHCVPPWSSDELETFCENATRYAQNEEGAWALPPVSEVFGETLGKLLAEDKAKPAKRSRFYFEDDDEQNIAPDPTWQLKGLIPDAATVLWLGSKGSFKSFIVEHILLSGAADREFAGMKPVRPGPAFYGAHEGRNAIKKPRKNAWKIAHGIEGRLPFYVARAPHIIDPQQCEEFREEIRKRVKEDGRRPFAIVLDTVAKCMTGLNENDARDVGLFTAFCDSLRDEFDCPVIAQHHLGKDAGRGGRGSSALAANFDTVVTTTRKPKTLLVSIEVNNHKDAEEPEHPFHFKGQQIGPSLVFFSVPPDEFAEAESEDNPLDKRKIGKVLQELNAYGRECGVTTQVLATEMTPARENQSSESLADAQAKTARDLGRLSKSKLEAYCERGAGGLMWFLPAKTD